MKIYITLLLMTLAALTVNAQKGLAIADVFEDYHGESYVSETIVSGKQLKGTGLDTYRCIIVNGKHARKCAAKIAGTVAVDAASAVGKEVSYVDGQLFFGQYTMKPSGKKNRYIFFVNSTLRGDDRVMLVYMEGSASPEQVRKLINKK